MRGTPLWGTPLRGTPVWGAFVRGGGSRVSRGGASAGLPFGPSARGRCMSSRGDATCVCLGRKRRLRGRGGAEAAAGEEAEAEDVNLAGFSPTPPRAATAGPDVVHARGTKGGWSAEDVRLAREHAARAARRARPRGSAGWLRRSTRPAPHVCAEAD